MVIYREGYLVGKREESLFVWMNIPIKSVTILFCIVQRPNELNMRQKYFILLSIWVEIAPSSKD